MDTTTSENIQETNIKTSDLSNETINAQEISNENLNNEENTIIDKKEVNIEQQNQVPVEANSLNEVSVNNQIEKIKVGEKEYTQEELTNIINNSNDIQQPQRTLETVQTELSKLTDNIVNDYISFGKKYIAKTNILNNDPQAAVEAYIEGYNTGNYDKFISFLSPIDVSNFVLEKQNLDYNYNNSYTKLNQEKETLTYNNLKQEDIKQWDNFIEQNYKSNPAESYILNKLKNESGFEEGKIKEFVQWFREAVALDSNKEILNNQTEQMKKDMMGSNVKGINNNNGNRIFTRKEIDKMSHKDFAKYEKQIFEQMTKGLIK